MRGYEDTNWARTETQIASFVKKLDKMRAEDRPAEVMFEIAVQLMWLNAHIEEVHNALHRIADSK